MTIFVTWQLRVTLDSIRNYCDVYDKILLQPSLNVEKYIFSDKGILDPFSVKSPKEHRFIVVACKHLAAKIKRSEKSPGCDYYLRTNTEVKPNSLLKGVQPKLTVTLKFFVFDMGDAKT